MYRVVLVDDEELELTGIQKLVPWKELHMEVKAACPDGFSALHYLEENEADILVSDIRMPIMSGLELASKAQRLHPNLKILFISGYEDFQYAKQALSMKASGYVLKPINDDELLGALQSVRSALDGENRQQQREQSIQQSMVYLKNELLERCLEGTPDRDAVIELMAQFRLGVQVGRLRAAIIEMEDKDWRTENQYSEAAQAEQLVALTSLCSRNGMEMYCRLSARRLAVVMEESHGMIILERMIEELSASHHATLTIGLGQPVDELEQLHLSYEEAGKALAMKMFQGKGKIIAYSATKEEAQESALNIQATVDALFAAMTQYELVRIVDCMEELFQQVKNIKNPSAVRNYSFFVISRLDAYLNSLNESLLTDQNGFALDKLFDFETIDDIHFWLRRKIFELSEQLHNKRQRKNVKLIGQIQSYIDQRLGESISLKEVAQAFSFSPNYLGHLFKEETGELFSDYLMRGRMELAKRLLADTGMKVYEVADRVGSGTLAHFGKQFKDYTGMTPGEYRKHL
ncbi:response regulator [Paenibacillus sp. 1011MAR3C5]|uniref:response regulator n=1 Tax=Paenibacillus sp. 1011MAR3C5 TaxID=1675787 RepID=UPI000E6B621E|nr:response regulator [Paenibacillus sp. 1011MAR3C5]RJE88800.1 response regulator [Paenibacillus sp. 1011MAR3C5]